MRLTRPESRTQRTTGFAALYRLGWWSFPAPTAQRYECEREADPCASHAADDVVTHISHNFEVKVPAKSYGRPYVLPQPLHTAPNCGSRSELVARLQFPVAVVNCGRRPAVRTRSNSLVSVGRNIDLHSRERFPGPGNRSRSGFHIRPEPGR